MSVGFYEFLVKIITIVQQILNIKSYKILLIFFRQVSILFLLIVSFSYYPVLKK